MQVNPTLDIAAHTWEIPNLCPSGRPYARPAIWLLPFPPFLNGTLFPSPMTGSSPVCGSRSRSNVRFGMSWISLLSLENGIAKRN